MDNQQESIIGRPRKELDMEQVKKLVQIQCTAHEVSGYLDISTDTLDRRLKEQGYIGFADYFKKTSTAGKISLRRKQFEVATGGNVTMLIWLGKQYLEQTDKVDQLHLADADNVIEIIRATRPN